MTRLLVQEKNMCWIFVQNPIQKNLAQYKVLHMTFLLITRRICICVQIIKHLEIGLNLQNGVLSYSMWKLFIPLNGAYLPHLIHLGPVNNLKTSSENYLMIILKPLTISRADCQLIWRNLITYIDLNFRVFYNL